MTSVAHLSTTIRLAVIFSFLLIVMAFANQAHAKAKRQYPTCAYKTQNMIKKPKIEKFNNLKKCTLRRAARYNIKGMNWIFKKMIAEVQRKAINKELRKLMKKHPKKRKKLRAQLIKKLSLHFTLKSFKGKIISRSRKNCRIKFTKMIVRLRSCQTSKGL